MSLLAQMRSSPVARVVGAAFLVLLLQIPVALIHDTVSERRQTRDAAVADVTRAWGGSQEIAGPVLTVTVVRPTRYPDGEIRDDKVTHRVLPQALRVTGSADVEIRKRGIFDVPLYITKLRLEGTFRVPAAVAGARRSVSVTLGVSDPKGIRALSPLTFDGRAVQWEPGPTPPLQAGVHASFATALEERELPFSLELSLGGSERLAIVPVGSDTQIMLTSPWPAPGFDGWALPVERAVGANGFSARWSLSHLGRNYPASWTEMRVDAQALSASAVAVSFLPAVDTYRNDDRAVKYQLLFLGLTFLCFTLFELLSGLRIHPIQSLFVGLALCLFYLLLISLSEQLGFGRAYLIAACATVWLVGMYVRFVLASAGRALAIGGVLAGLYGFLYVLLQIEDYALLAGSVALFAVLATVMWITRRVDWYRLHQPPECAPVASSTR